MTNEFERIWARIEGLERAVASLIDVQQQQLATASAAVNQNITTDLQAQLSEIKTSLTGSTAREAAPAEITVGRINVVEPDGTLRLAIYNQVGVPDGIINGKAPISRKGDPFAGLMFYNSEGDECGGLGYSSKRMPDGSIQAVAGLTFDRFKQDQVIGLLFDEIQGQVSTGLHVWDRPTLPLDQWFEQLQPIFEMPQGPEQQAKFAELRRAGLLGSERAYVGSRHGKAEIHLCDAQQQVRIRLFTEADGRAGLEFLDESGKVTNRWPTQDL